MESKWISDTIGIDTIGMAECKAAVVLSCRWNVLDGWVTRLLVHHAVFQGSSKLGWKTSG